MSDDDSDGCNQHSHAWRTTRERRTREYLTPVVEKLLQVSGKVGPPPCARSTFIFLTKVGEGNRQFCEICGSYLIFCSEESPNEVSINTASFDNSDAFPPRMHIFAESRLSWFRTDDNLPVYNGYGPFDRHS